MVSDINPYCHLNNEELYSVINDIISEIENENNEFIEEGKDNFIKRMVEYYSKLDPNQFKRFTRPEYWEHYFINRLETNNKNIENIRSGIYNSIEYYSDGMYKIIDGEVYAELGCPCPFHFMEIHKTRFTKENIYTKEDLLEFIKEHPDNIVYYPDEGSHLFYSGLTDELQKRIDDFYDNYGKYNICLQL